MNKNANQAFNSFLLMREDFHQDNGQSTDLDQKRSGILLTKGNHKENRTKSLNDDDKIRRKRTPSFFEPRVHCLEERS